jgi:phosphate transport system substrate-binding protein
MACGCILTFWFWWKLQKEKNASAWPPIQRINYMKKLAYTLLLFAFAHTISFAQELQKEIIITGTRFTYPLLEKWIADYQEVDPSVRIRIEPRTNVDPSQYDLLIEAFEHDNDARADREYLYLARYAVLPFANASSTFAKYYSEEGLTSDLIKQVFFHDIYASKEKQVEIKSDVNVYTRLQKAGAPKTFAQYFGFEQQQIKGKAIAGADEHLIKAVTKDSLGVSYGSLGLIYDLNARTSLPGITILPVDVNDNGRVSKDERFFGSVDEVIGKLESENLKNIPVEYLHLSIRKHGYKPEALKFLMWIIDNSQDDLHEFGFLKPEQKRFDSEKQKFLHLASKS